MSWGIISELKQINPVQYIFAVILFLVGISINIIPYPWNYIFLLILIYSFAVWIYFVYKNPKWLWKPLNLSEDWFNEQFIKFVAPSPGKFEFIEELHTETLADKFIHEFLLDDQFLIEFKKWYEQIQSHLEEYFISLKKLNKELPVEILFNSFDLKIIEKAVELEEKIINIKTILTSYYNHLKVGNFEECKKINLKQIYDDLEKIFREYETLANKFDNSKFDYNGKEEKKDKIFDEAKKLIQGPLESSLRILNTLGLLSKMLNSFDKHDLHIIGGANLGKTDTVSFICKQRLDNGLPALIISGRKFTGDSSIEKQFKEILDIPSKYSWKDFLDSLQSSAKENQTRLPLIIDGLNEATNNVGFSDIWETYLPGLIEDINIRDNVVLITTCRETYANNIWGDELPENKVFIRELDSDDTITAIKKYFKFYKIRANLTYSPLMQFSNPLYLRIFCETTNYDREEEIEIYIGEKTLFEVFDKFIEQTNKRVCKRLRIDSREKLVQFSLNKIADYLWENKERHIPHDTLFRLVDNKPRGEIRISDSKTFALEDEGLVIFRDMGESEEIVSFTYDLFGGYIIANFLIKQQNSNLKEFINSESTMELLFENEDFKKLHPLYEDIRHCIAALIPKNGLGFLHEYSNDDEVVTVSIKALFEISPDEIDDGITNFIKKEFKKIERRKLFFNLFRYTLTYKTHPLNSLFLFDLLKGLDIYERDLSWSEYIRSDLYIFERDIETFEKTFKGQKSFTKDEQLRISLYANYVIWFLSSTVRSFRDKTTRALYWYGRSFPEEFFKLVEKSFEINDLSVSERMLASLYGVSMALQYDFNDNSFKNNLLPIYGLHLYDLMFKKNAPFSTTDILRRDYARRTIEIALLHHPSLLSDTEKDRLKPPFKDGGIRNWGESEDKDEGKYRDMNYPMEGIVYEDPVSLLGSEMDKYQEPPAYVKAKANLWWRVYQFGYSLDLFGEIDKDIESWNISRRGRSEKAWAKTYGRKYVYIALHELAGYRDDLGLLRDEWELHRTSLVDIDPTFPAELTEFEIMDENILGKKTLTIHEWLSESENPNLKKYLILDEINGENGPWVLLDGYVGQTDEEVNRDVFTFPRGLFVKSENEKELIKLLRKQVLYGRWLPEIPEDHYVFAGEIPWCETFPENEWDQLTFDIGTELVPFQTKIKVLMRKGVRLNKDEEEEFYERLSYEVIVNPKSDFPKYERDNWPRVIETRRLLSSIGKKSNSEKETSKDEKTYIYDEYEELIGINCKDPKSVLESELKKQGLDREVVEVEIKEERTIYEKVEVLIPVRNNEWEMYHSPIIPSRNVSVPNKQVAEFLDLCNQPQTFDLFEKNGKKASISLEYGEEYKNNQHYVFLRKDLLDHYLSSNEYSFLWAIWGSKEYYSLDFNKAREFREKNEDRFPFQDIISYEK